jgi:hypothetical protein
MINDEYVMTNDECVMMNYHDICNYAGNLSGYQVMKHNKYGYLYYDINKHTA